MVSAVIPPPAMPAMPRKTYNCVEVCAKEQQISAAPSNPIADRNTTFRPKISDMRPYSTWKQVLPISEDVPAHDIVCRALRSRPIVGSMIPMAFWSIMDMNRLLARARKTTMSCLRGRRFVWSLISTSFGMFLSSSFVLISSLICLSLESILPSEADNMKSPIRTLCYDIAISIGERS